MTPDYKQLLTGWLKGHTGAIAFIDLVFSVAHTCDDLTDGDKTITASEVQDSYWKALIELPRNMFYVEHFALLNGALQLAFLNWHIANRLELEDTANAKEIAFILRSSYADLVTLCAWAIGGTEWAKLVGYESRLYTSREGFASYLHSLSNEQRSANIVTGA